MTQIFLISTAAEVACDTRLRTVLEARGYTVWVLPAHINVQSAMYPDTLELGIRSSSVVVLLWSDKVAGDEWAERMLLYAQRLRRPIITISLDNTILPITVVDVPGISAANCDEAANQLLLLLPSPSDNDLLLALLTSTRIPEQKRGVNEAAAAIARGERAEELMAQLEELVRISSYGSVVTEARKVLDRLDDQLIKQAEPARSRHEFRARCRKGHTSWFDLRDVCRPCGTVQRSLVRKAGKEVSEILLTCLEPDCGEMLVVRIDCAGYT